MRREYSYYTEGNTARELSYSDRNVRQRTSYERNSAVPVRREEQPYRTAPKKKTKPLSKRQERQVVKETSRARYKRMNSESMSLPYLMFLSVLVVVAAVLCVTYLNYQAEISSAKSNIQVMKSEVGVVQAQNDAIAYDIEAYIDINRIIRIATKDLGMIMADDDQIKYFKKDTNEFMNQYADVPEE